MIEVDSEKFIRDLLSQILGLDVKITGFESDTVFFSDCCGSYSLTINEILSTIKPRDE